MKIMTPEGFGSGIGISASALAVAMTNLDWFSFLNDFERLTSGALLIAISAVTLYKKLKDTQK